MISETTAVVAKEQGGFEEFRREWLSGMERRTRGFRGPRKRPVKALPIENAHHMEDVIRKYFENLN